MPFGPDEDVQSQPIDWDEFHSTSPYDTYAPRTPPRKGWSLLLGIVLNFATKIGVSLFLCGLIQYFPGLRTEKVLRGVHGSRKLAQTLAAFVTSILTQPRGRLDGERAEPPLRQIIEVLLQLMCTHDAEKLAISVLEIYKGETSEGRSSD
jgi:hypothetical protein